MKLACGMGRENNRTISAEKFVMEGLDKRAKREKGCIKGLVQRAYTGNLNEKILAW